MNFLFILIHNGPRGALEYIAVMREAKRRRRARAAKAVLS